MVDKDLDERSVVYSFGVGTDISFDLALIDKFGSTIHAFDPTPKSIEWIKQQSLPKTFVLHEYGLAASDGIMTFYPPENPDHVSHTAIARDTAARKTAARETAGPDAIQVQMKQLSTIMNELGHKDIALLKMDIEGSEYEVIRSLVSSPIRPKQLLVEFHHRFPEIGTRKTLLAIQQLRQIGYRLFSVSDSGEEFGFEYHPDET